LNSTDLTLDGVQRTAGLAPLAPSRDKASGIGFENVSVAYKGAVVLADLDLVISPGEIVAIIGPSGSGKTTALRAVAGFVRPVRGRIRIGERDVTDLPPYERGIGMVVQNYALFPHMRVEENVAFGLNARRAARADVEAQVRQCLRMVGMQDFARRYPRELSGGQQQRVAIARALVHDPKLIVCDEPTSNLDHETGQRTMEALRALAKRPDRAVIVVTHDPRIFDFADRIAHVDDGTIVDVESPTKERVQ